MHEKKPNVGQFFTGLQNIVELVVFLFLALFCIFYCAMCMASIRKILLGSLNLFRIVLATIVVGSAPYYL